MMKHEFYKLFISLFMVSLPVYTQIIKKEYTVYGIGDSHINFTLRDQEPTEERHSLWQVENPTVRLIHLNENTSIQVCCYSHSLVGKTLHGTKQIPMRDLIKPDLIDYIDCVLFTFGEVDIRGKHISNHTFKQGKSYKQIIEELTVPFIQNILDLQNTIPALKGKLVVMAVILCTIKIFMPTLDNPIITNIELRNALNDSLEKHAVANDIKFFNPYVLCATEDDRLLPIYTTDGIHMATEHNHIILKELFKSCILNN